MADEIIDEKENHQPMFWDSWWALGLMIAAIFFGRFYVIEPFKIPTGSMEPELIGHDDYGDRIGTNKLAYAKPSQVSLAMAGTAAIIVAAVAWSIGYNRGNPRARPKRTILYGVVLFVLLVGGMGFAWSKGAMANEPRRFEVVVFLFDKAWAEQGSGKQNYIKRLVGLPGETITVSGGDLFKYNKLTGKDEIIRKWEEGGKDLQESLWYPISKAWTCQFPDASEEDRNRINFPWSGVAKNTPGTKLTDKDLTVDGAKELKLAYMYPATNVYLKHGRWPFEHAGCPAANKPGIKSDGLIFRNPQSTPEEFSAYVDSTWNGVQCPYCKQVMFPIERFPASPNIRPLGEGTPKTNFFYGGDKIVGDLKLDVDVDVVNPGKLELQVGNSLHSALWKIPNDGSGEDHNGVHPVKTHTSALTPGRHHVSLAYVDATVMAKLDGQEIECRKIADVVPPGSTQFESVAEISLVDFKGTIHHLDLFRDLFYTSKTGGMSRRASQQMRGPGPDGNFVVEEIPSAKRGADQDYYFMMGDNSPGSYDSRGWGFVPADQIVGRGSFIWWPPSRWGAIK